MEKVIVYSTQTCPYCDMVKNFLKEKEVEFEEIDVGSDKEKAQEMVEKSGQMGVPVVEIGGEMVVGFNKERIDELLKEKGISKE
ncbi:glutaredoxin family protein [Candidatus Woesearchaeota archaeon]|jgi:glutaredoxin 3|nr:glutaredoxin family protein [Candidatus Woesearchaeota archaeon]MBT4322189.1 glutaredoxin family protein [Candidatus Woesearchaeota archaeon]MBT4631209.1 glutaredoxin family protein [Candidatus Woesearchaeota archaeon]